MLPVGRAGPVPRHRCAGPARPPRRRRVGPAGLVGEVRAAVAERARSWDGSGTVAVITPRPGGPARPGRPAATGRGAHPRTRPRVSEFDVVVVVDPGAIAAGRPADLYVAMTRATRRLVLV